MRRALRGLVDRAHLHIVHACVCTHGTCATCACATCACTHKYVRTSTHMSRPAHSRSSPVDTPVDACRTPHIPVVASVARRPGPQQPWATPRPPLIWCVRVGRAPQYAFYNCGKLKRLVFEDRAADQTLAIGVVSRARAGRRSAPPPAHKSARVCSRAPRMQWKRTCLRVRVCWNTQQAFRLTGLDHDGGNPLTIPAAVTSIGDVSERARSSTAPLRVRRTSLSACAERPASPSPSTARPG